MILSLALLLIFPAIMALAASSDLFTMTISNRLTLARAAGFFIMAPWVGLGWQEMAWHGATGLGVLAIGFGLFAMGWIGGGDAKLMAATALWFGTGELLNYLLYFALLGGALTFILLQFRLFTLPAFAAKQEWVQRLHTKNGGVPYGIALAIAALIVYPQTIWVKAADLAQIAG